MARYSAFRFESMDQPLLDRAGFARRLARSAAAVGQLVGPALLAGVAGYGSFEGMPWIDAFANAAVILSGRGAAGAAEDDERQAVRRGGGYAPFSGLVMSVATGTILAPVVHGVPHQFHLDAGRRA
jgi:hypothetical protein